MTVVNVVIGNRDLGTEIVLVSIVDRYFLRLLTVLVGIWRDLGYPDVLVLVRVVLRLVLLLLLDLRRLVHRVLGIVLNKKKYF